MIKEVFFPWRKQFKNDFKTIEKDFYNRLFQLYFPGEGNSNEIIYHVPIRSAKKSEINNFHPYAHAIKYFQLHKNTCCLSSLEYDLFVAIEHVAEQVTAFQIKSSLFFELFGYLDRIKFSNKVMTSSVGKKGEHRCCYELVKCKTKV